MARLTKREILILLISVILFAPLVVWSVLFVLSILFDEPNDTIKHAGTDETTIQRPRE